MGTKGPKPTGALVPHVDGGHSVRVRYCGARLTLNLETCASETEAIERKAALAFMAARLARSSRAREGKDLLERAARAKAGQAWEAFEVAVDAICSGDVEEVDAPKVPTFEAFAKTWTDGDLHRAHPDHVPLKDSTRDEEVLRLHINPTIGSLPVSAVTLRHAEHVMGSIPAKRSPATRKLIAQAMRRVLALAVYPGRYLAANPIPAEWMPKVPTSTRKAKASLFPEEERALLGCKRVPLIRRMAYGILAREGMRASELGNLRWSDVDLQRGVVRLDKNKTDDPRAWALSVDVLAALKAWRKRNPDDERVLSVDAIPLDVVRLADSLRADLKRAGVKRPELFERSATRMQIRAHDLRALFVTVSLANGKTETWVADRTGHASSEMINRYRRQARTWAETELGTLAPMVGAVPELSATGRGLAVDWSRLRDLNSRPTVYEGEDLPQEEPDTQETPGETTAPDGATEPHAEANGQQWPVDPVEAALAHALREATDARRWDVVAQLAGELQARRTARAGNVVPIGKPTRKGGPSR